jgi:tetratricopeptide (TPR) repeat protein
MADRCRWDVSLDCEATVTVSQVANDDIDDGRCGYRLTLESTEYPTDLAVTGTIDAVVATPEQDESAPAVVVTLPEDHGISRVSVRHRDHDQRLFLPGSILRQQCLAAIDGDVDAARTLLSTFDDPIQVPAMCGAFLDLREIGALIETLGRVNRYTAGRLHSYRYPLIRSAIASSTGLSVTSADELENLVEALDNVDRVGQVRLLDSVGEVMATVSVSSIQTDRLLEDFGFDRETVERRRSGLLFACFLSQLVITEGIEAARELALKRDWWLDGDYEARKTRTENIEYRERGEAWRKLLCAGARRSRDEFTQVLANALYWSGETSRTDSRLDELLFEGATTVAADIGLEYIEGRAQYEQTVSKGHRLRSQNRYELATQQFSEALEIASDYHFLPEWEPVYAKANAQSAALDTSGAYEAAVDVLDEVVEDILQYNVPEEKLNHIIHHLEGKKQETQAKLADFADESETPVTLLEEARTHYDVIGLERSKSRTEQKLENIRSVTSEPDTGAESASPSEAQTTTSAEAAAHGVTSTKANAGRGEHVRSDHARSEFETNPELHDGLAPPDTDEAGSADLMTSPDDREEDPYAGTGEWDGQGWRDADEY